MSGADSTGSPLHLLSVWNPSYADDALDRHLEVLLSWAERRDEGEAEEDDVYVWWGKLRSPRREEALPDFLVCLILDRGLAVDGGGSA